MRTQSILVCRLCGAVGDILYAGLSDRLLGTPGVWDLRQCPKRDCALIWLDPAPVEEDLLEAYAAPAHYTHEPADASQDIYGRILDGYMRIWVASQTGSRPLWYRLMASSGVKLFAAVHPGGRAELDYAAAHLPVPVSGSRVLDVGCGGGKLLARLRIIGWNVEGIDLDPGAVETARAAGFDVRLGSLADQQYDNESFDAIVMSHVIEHVPNPVELLTECRRVLKVGGSLVVLTPNSRALGRQRFGGDWFALDPPRHLMLFNRGNLRRAVESADLTPTVVKTSAREARLIWSISRRLASHQGPGVSTGVDLKAEVRGIPDQIRQRLRLRTNPDSGEEIVLVARRQQASAAA